MKKFWFYLNANTFLWRDKNFVLVYNSIRFSGFTLPINGIQQIIESILLPTNMYCVTLDEVQLSDPIVECFVNLVIKNSAGNIIECLVDTNKPVIFYPAVNVKHNFKKYDEKARFRLDDEICNSLSEVTISLCGTKPKVKAKKYLQFLYPSDINNILPCEIALNFIIKLRSWPIDKINLVGLNSLNIHNYILILDYLKSNQLKATIFLQFNYLNSDIRNFLKTLDNFNIVLIVEHFSNIKFDNTLLKSVVCDYPNIKYEFIVECQKEFFSAIKIIDSYGIINHSVKPYFNGTNLNFFLKHVYIDPDDLLNQNLNKRQIFAHQTINTFDYGRITLLPNGLIYANVNFPAIGHVNDNLKEIIFNEHTNGKSWMRTRSLSPCNECLFQWLCPSPSNYELVIGKPNLCNLKK